MGTDNNMEYETVRQLRAENERLRHALIEIKDHIRQIDKLFEGLEDILNVSEKESLPATSDEIKDLLKKYSRL